MKLCERCGERPVVNVHGRYCEDCREKAKAEAKARAKETQPIRNAKYRAKKQAQKQAQKRKSQADEGAGLSEPAKRHDGCPGCAYWRLFYASMKACHYTIDTGKVRPMPAAECYGREGTPYKPKVQL